MNKLQDINLNKDFKDEKFNETYEYIEIKSCNFSKCDFSLGHYNGIDISNSVLEDSNLSNLDLTDRTYQYVTFKNCNMIGVSFIDSYLDNVVFENCNLKYSNFTGCHFKDVKFDSCNLDEVSFNELNWKKLSFSKCHMWGTEFYKTTLKDIDLSSCDISTLKLDINHIQGLIIDYYQSMVIASILGIKIKDD